MADSAPPGLERVVAALREPVELDAGLAERVLWAARRHGVPRRQRVTRGGLIAVGGALAAAVLVALVIPKRPQHSAERLVPFVLSAPTAAHVTVVGDFNDWDPRATPLKRLSPEAWGVMLELPPGRYRYAFVLDGSRWIADPTAPASSDNDFGSRSSVLTILARGT